jgi:lipopolysaccharide transport system ATP-binding protein
MSGTAIRVEGVSKEFRIGALQGSFVTLRETIVDTLSAPLRRARNLIRGQAYGAAELEETFLALDDVSFDVKRGEVVGIIGGNGAGKSTLLKILSRIYEPTKGSVEIYGRVGSLLEVGTGFHPELTGRENTYLNGAILGMTKREIDKKFDEIVAFSEVEKFIDTPVKHYSSGMYLRLAFSVAAHLEPEILIVDEVLAVGDAQFQKKCIGKMEDVGAQGRTVLFVSHNMSAITRLCERVVLLSKGKIVQNGPPQKVVDSYLHLAHQVSASCEWEEPKMAPGAEVAGLCALRARSKDGLVATSIDIRQPLGLEMEYVVNKSGYVLMPLFMVSNQQGVRIFNPIDTDPAWRQRPRPQGRYISTAWIPGNFLTEGTIVIGAALTTVNPTIHQFTARDAIAVEITESQINGSNEGETARGAWKGDIPGVIRPLLSWETVHLEAREQDNRVTAASTQRG